MQKEYYLHQSEGNLIFDPGHGSKHFKPWWSIVQCSQDIIDYYCWLSKKWCRPLMKNKLWGPHISFIKGEIPPNQSQWGKNRVIYFNYSNIIRYDNDCHAWLDVWSEDLIKLREEFGLLPKVKMSYHLTLGRI